MLLSVPQISVPEIEFVTAVSTGKFCKRFAPKSASLASLPVTPAPPRSMPRSPFEKMRLPRMALLVEVVAAWFTPSCALKAMMFASPVLVPPMTFQRPAVRSTP